MGTGDFFSKKQKKEGFRATNRLVKTIVEELKSYNPEKIILFGSAVRDEFDENSDLDFLLIKKTKKRMVERIGDVLNCLKTYDVPVEPIVYTPAEMEKMKKEGRLFIENILKEGKLVYVGK